MNLASHQRTITDHRNPRFKLIFYILLLFVVVALAMYAYLGSFTRYMADDYCTAASLKDVGFWKSQLSWWQHWSGRYSFTFLVSAVELFGVRIVPILPAVILILWWGSLVWVLSPFIKRLQIPDPVSISILAAGAALWMTYRTFEDYPQIVFWQTGILTYPVTLILFSMGMGVAIRRSSVASRETWLGLFLWFLFAFLAGGFSETGAVFQIVFLGLLLLFTGLMQIEKKKMLFSIALATLLGSIASLFIIALAPGNLVRAKNFQHIPPLLPSIAGSLYETLAFIPNFIKAHTFLVAFGFFVGCFLSYFSFSGIRQFETRKIIQHYIASLLIAEAAIWVGIAPSYLLRGGAPPQRVLLFSYFLVACMVIYWGALSAILLSKALPQKSHVLQEGISAIVLLFLIAWGAAPVFVSQVQLIPVLKQYATMWDGRDQSIVAAAQSGESRIVLDDLTQVWALRKLNKRLWTTGDFESDPTYWINLCGAQYYGVEQIIAK
jgi:hypothetical protein